MCVCGGGGVELPIYEITGGVLNYPFPHKKCHDFVKCCIKTLMHLDLRPDNMLFGGLQPIADVTLAMHAVG